MVLGHERKCCDFSKYAKRQSIAWRYLWWLFSIDCLINYRITWMRNFWACLKDILINWGATPQTDILRCRQRTKRTEHAPLPPCFLALSTSPSHLDFQPWWLYQERWAWLNPLFLKLTLSKRSIRATARSQVLKFQIDQTENTGCLRWCHYHNNRL